MPSIDNSPRTDLLEKDGSDRWVLNRWWDKWFQSLSVLFPRTITLDIDVANVAANSTSLQTFTVPGATLGDVVKVAMPSEPGLVISSALIASKDMVQIAFTNVTAGAINPATASYTFIFLRR